MSKAEEIFTFTAFIRKHSLKAVLVRLDDEDIWLPRSQIIDDEELPQEGEAEITVTAWIAKTKGLI